MGVQREERILRDELEANPLVLGRFLVMQPASVLFIENLGGESAELHIQRADTFQGPFYPVYTDDTPVAVVGHGRTSVVLTDVTEYLAFHLSRISGDGVRLTLVGFSPLNEAPLGGTRQVS